MPIFTREFCRQFLEEIEHFEADQSLPKGRPNTMNKYGVSNNAQVCTNIIPNVYVSF